MKLNFRFPFWVSSLGCELKSDRRVSAIHHSFTFSLLPFQVLGYLYDICCFELPELFFIQYSIDLWPQDWSFHSRRHFHSWLSLGVQRLDSLFPLCLLSPTLFSLSHPSTLQLYFFCIISPIFTPSFWGGIQYGIPWGKFTGKNFVLFFTSKPSLPSGQSRGIIQLGK